MVQRPRLADATLASARAEVPGYDRTRADAGVVHLGLGAFSRAHQAVAFDDLLRRGHTGWAVIGVSLRQPDVRDALLPQDGLYTLAIRSASVASDRIVGCVKGVLHAVGDPRSVVDRLADPHTRVVTVTVTEKGYAADPATGALDEDHAAVVHDRVHPELPIGMLGHLVAGLRARRAAGEAPFTVMSCDNLPANGARLRALCTAMASLVDKELGEWIAERVSFPSTMVDRIVPATTDALREEVASRTGVFDAWPVLAEPYTQWVVERLGAPPELAEVGVELVEDVAPWEQLKLRVLNALHSAAAYLGVVRGLDTIADVVSDQANRLFLDAVVDEILDVLDAPAGVDARAYARQALGRFENAALGHRCAQVAMDGSQKLPQRLLPTVRARLANGLAIDATAKVLALWSSHVLAVGPGARLPVDDPLADRFAAVARGSSRDLDAMVRGLLHIREIFGDDLGQDARFVDPVAGAFHAVL